MTAHDNRQQQNCPGEASKATESWKIRISVSNYLEFVIQHRPTEPHAGGIQNGHTQLVNVQIGISTLKNGLALFPKVEHVHTIDSTEKHEHVDQIYPQAHSQLRWIALNWKRRNHSPAAERINMLSNTHVLECCTSTNKLPLHTTVCVNHTHKTLNKEAGNNGLHFIWFNSYKVPHDSVRS